MDFSGKVALVTGAGSGVGRATALLFARHGAAVVLVGRRPAEIAVVADEITEAGGQALAVPADISDAAQVEGLVARAVAQFGRLDAAFNNAGIEGAWAPITELAPEDFDRTLAVNLRGAWLCCKHEMSATQRPFVDHTPAQRLGTPEEVAKAVVWLCSDGARFVNGQNLLVDGGYAIPGHRAWLSGAVAAEGPIASAAAAGAASAAARQAASGVSDTVA